MYIFHHPPAAATSKRYCRLIRTNDTTIGSALLFPAVFLAFNPAAIVVVKPTVTYFKYQHAFDTTLSTCLFCGIISYAREQRRSNAYDEMLSNVTCRWTCILFECGYDGHGHASPHVIGVCKHHVHMCSPKTPGRMSCQDYLYLNKQNVVE